PRRVAWAPGPSRSAAIPPSQPALPRSSSAQFPAPLPAPARHESAMPDFTPPCLMLWSSSRIGLKYYLRAHNGNGLNCYGTGSSHVSGTRGTGRGGSAQRRDDDGRDGRGRDGRDSAANGGRPYRDHHPRDTTPAAGTPDTPVDDRRVRAGDRDRLLRPGADPARVQPAHALLPG